MARKLQTTLEFAIVTGFVLMFFSIFMFVIQRSISDKLEERTNLELIEIAKDAQSEINLALEASDGYYREFDIPDRVGNLDYSIQMVDEMVYVNTTDNRYALSLPIPNATGYLRTGRNIIRKENGEIKLNQ